MKFIKLKEQQFEEYLFDFHKKMLYKKDSKEATLSEIERYNFGFVDIKTMKKGGITLVNNSTLLKHNVMLNAEKLENNIMFFFNKRDESFAINSQTGKQIVFKTNSNGVYFNNSPVSKEHDVILKDTRIEYSCLVIPPDYFERLVNMYPNLFEKSFMRYQKGESFYLNEHFAQSTNLHYNILSQIENSQLMGNSSDLYVDAKVLELLSLHFGSITDNQVVNNKPFNHYNKINEAAYILTADLNNPPSVRELSLKVGLNPNILRAGFKKVFDNTVYGYLFDYKMQLAMQFLQDTSLPVVEVAFKCGYDYVSHFCTAFKRKYGMSPNKMRGRKSVTNS